MTIQIDPSNIDDLLSRRVSLRVFSACDPTIVMASGQLIGYCRAPSVTLREHDGTKSSWSTKLPMEEIVAEPGGEGGSVTGAAASSMRPLVADIRLDTEQAMPVPNDSPSVQGMVREDLVTREQIGVERYGTALQPNNGRDALRDAYEEALDLACYLRQAIAERRREDVEAAVTDVHRALGHVIHNKDGIIDELRRQLNAADRVRKQAVVEARQLRESAGQLSQARLLAATWRADPGAFPDGAADPLEQIAGLLVGPRSTGEV